MLHSLGALIHRRARWFVVVWALLVGVGFAASTGVVGEGLFARLHASTAQSVPGESRDGLDLLIAAQHTGGSVMLMADGVDPADPRLTQALTAARARLVTVAHVASVTDPVVPPLRPSPFVSADGRAVLVTATLAPDLDDAAQDAAITAAEAHLTALAGQVRTLFPGATTRVGGLQQLIDEINGHVTADLKTGEGAALPVSLIVMVIVFGGFLAASLPILGAIASIGVALLTLLGFSYAMELDSSVPNVVSVLGLGLCIDYGLLLASRYREEVRRLHALSPDPSASPSEEALEGALEHTLGTAGRTVLFSGVTVAISLLGLLFFHASILRAVGAAGVSVVVVAVLVALTLVPALLALAGDRMVRPGVTHRIPGLDRLARRLGDVSPEEGAFSRLAERVQRHPWLVALGCLAVLLLAAAPVLGIQLVTSGASMLPVDSTQRQLFESVAARFPAASNPPISVVTRASAAELTAWGRSVSSLEGVTSLDPIRELGDGAARVRVLGVRTAGDPKSGDARAVVERLRERRPAFQVWVTGEPAQVYDYLADLRARAPYAIGVVVLTTFVLLFLMTGSVLVPIKALIINTISLGASFGVLVWVFQHGHLESLLQFSSNGGIDQTIPALALAFAFGLSMDYEVFLLSRIKETRDALAATGGAENPNDIAVRHGLQRSGRIITSAALIVVIVFAGFVAGKLLIIKQIGVALAVAVTVDATLVRMLLVPATMTLLGEWNWWAPAPLRRLHERFGIREG